MSRAQVFRGKRGPDVRLAELPDERRVEARKSRWTWLEGEERVACRGASRCGVYSSQRVHDEDMLRACLVRTRPLPITRRLYSDSTAPNHNAELVEYLNNGTSTWLFQAPRTRLTLRTVLQEEKADPKANQYRIRSLAHAIYSVQNASHPITSGKEAIKVIKRHVRSRRVHQLACSFPASAGVLPTGSRCSYRERNT